MSSLPRSPASAMASAAMKKAREEEEQKILDAIARKDYAKLNAIKATQYGVLDRLKELVESGQCDPNLPDDENVYLLHWAAINNRVDIAKYLIKGIVDICSPKEQSCFIFMFKFVSSSDLNCPQLNQLSKWCRNHISEIAYLTI